MATHHVRHLSHPSKKSQSAHARPSRPLSKRLHSQGKAAPKPSSSKEADLVCAQAKHIDDVDDDDDQDSMAVSFLNYCTVCEKQIVVPSNTVLYCSESCKKKDAEKSIHDYYYDHYSPPTTPFANFSFDDFTFRDIVPQRSPTQPDSKRSSCAFSDVSSDEHSDNHYHSDASKFLRKFYSTPAPSDASRQNRPRYSRTSTSQYSTSAAPSLSHTPASSVSYSLPYTPATTRPLPPRTKSSRHGSYGGKSIDLVTPVTAPSSPKSYSHKSPAVSRTSVSTIEGEIVYAKSPVPEPSVASSSLGRLLASSPQHHA